MLSLLAAAALGDARHNLVSLASAHLAQRDVIPASDDDVIAARSNQPRKRPAAAAAADAVVPDDDDHDNDDDVIVSRSTDEQLAMTRCSKFVDAVEVSCICVNDVHANAGTGEIASGQRFWATVCKTVRSKLSDRCLPVCLYVGA